MTGEATSPPETGAALIRGRLLATNSLWSFFGQLTPALVGIASIPMIVKGLGPDRFGLLLIAWMVVGYFSLFDLGLGRAVTRSAAEIIGSGNTDRLKRVVWTAWYLMAALGIGAGILAFAGLPKVVFGFIDVPGELVGEAAGTLRILAIGIPIVVMNAAVRGLLEANQRFALLTAVRIPVGTATYLVPLLVLLATPDLRWIVAGLVSVRAIGSGIYVIRCFITVPDIRRPVGFDRGAARELLGFGAWMTVSNVVRPLMVNVDRFFVGGMISLTAVTYYATPFEAITKLSIVPASLAVVFFPAFSTASAIDRTKLNRLFSDGVSVVGFVLLPIALTVVALAPEILALWLGPEFALQSTRVLRVLMVGVLMNSMAWLAYALIQGLGRADITAKIHVVLAPLYFVILVAMISRYGINGAAYAWALRTTVEMALLHWRAGAILDEPHSPTVKRLSILVPATVVLVVVSAIPSLAVRLAVVATGGIIDAFFLWRFFKHRFYDGMNTERA